MNSVPLLINISSAKGPTPSRNAEVAVEVMESHHPEATPVLPYQKKGGGGGRNCLDWKLSECLFPSEFVLHTFVLFTTQTKMHL
jgi:hypothetical protein